MSKQSRNQQSDPSLGAKLAETLVSPPDDADLSGASEPSAARIGSGALDSSGRHARQGGAISAEALREYADEAAAQRLLGDRLQGKYMTFKLGKEEYGLEILKVRELIRLMEITRVPKTSGFIRGVINLRGKVIPVVDLKLKFGMERLQETEQTVIIVVQYQRVDRAVTMGILVDEVLEVRDIKSDQIEPTPDFGSDTFDTEFLMGVGKAERRVILLLDIGKVLTAEESHQVGEAAQEPERLPPGADAPSASASSAGEAVL